MCPPGQDSEEQARPSRPLGAHQKKRPVCLCSDSKRVGKIWELLAQRRPKEGWGCVGRSWQEPWHMSAKETEAGAEARSSLTLCLLGANSPQGPAGPFFMALLGPHTSQHLHCLAVMAGSQKPGLCPGSDNRCNTIHISGGCAPSPLKTPVCFSCWESIPQPGIRG